MGILSRMFGKKEPKREVFDFEAWQWRKLTTYSVALQTLSSLQSQWDIVLRSQLGCAVTLELTDHWGMFEGTGIDAHVILEGKKFPDGMADLMRRAAVWSDAKNREFTACIEKMANHR